MTPVSAEITKIGRETQEKIGHNPVDLFIKISDNNIMVEKAKIKVGDLLRLKAVSNHGKNRIHQHGDTWRVLGTDSGSSFGHIHLESLNETFGGFEGEWKGRKVKDGRNILTEGDPNFEIDEIIREQESIWVK